MAGQVQLAFLLAIIALIPSDVAPLPVDQDYFLPDNLQIKVDLDDIVDDLLPFIRKFILENGMDPTELIDLSENVFPHLPGKLKGNVDLTKGWLQNLSHLKRSEHVTAIYEKKLLTLEINLGFDLLDFNYHYYLTYLFYKRQGDMYGRFYNTNVKTVVTIDLADYRLHLESVKFTKVGKYDIKFEGHLLDGIVNALTKVVTVVFRKQVLALIEDRSMIIFGAKIDEWNEMIPRPNRTMLINEWLGISKNKQFQKPLIE